ncbi:MAG: hypothetical protein ACYC6N_17520 [Pirellulaceae bacterium]
MSSNFHAYRQSPDFLAACCQRVRSLLRNCGSCRQCKTRCGLFASVCDTCGAQDPIRLPIAWALAPVGMCGAVLALWMWIH